MSKPQQLDVEIAGCRQDISLYTKTTQVTPSLYIFCFNVLLPVTAYHSPQNDVRYKRMKGWGVTGVFL